jgi:hypothetical protein
MCRLIAHGVGRGQLPRGKEPCARKVPAFLESHLQSVLDFIHSSASRACHDTIIISDFRNAICFMVTFHYERKHEH